MIWKYRESTYGILFVLVIALFIPAHSALGQVRYEAHFPDILGFKTLKCDFHSHTVFSDGAVWPDVRVREAWNEGLDAIAITDHIEYKPNEDYVNTEHNTPFAIAEPWANGMEILFPRGAEITRDTPPGHFNAIFLTDVDPLGTKKFIDAVRKANEQGAFVFWNHPGWQGPELGSWRKIHNKMYKNKWLHGIEVVNSGHYDPVAHQWCLEKDLTMLGNSDIHEPSHIQKSTPAKHRTITLVFAKEKTLESLKEALFAGRTAVWHENKLIGRRKYLDALFKASVEVYPLRELEEGEPLLKIKNRADIDIELKRLGTIGPEKLKVSANSILLRGTEIDIESVEEELILDYTVDNFLIAPGEGLPVQINIPLR